MIQPEDGDRPRYVSLTFSPDGSRLATAAFGNGVNGGPGPVVVWETVSGKRLATFPGRPEQVGKLEFTPDGRSLLIASRSGVRLWKCFSQPGETDPQPAGHKDEAWSLAFSSDGRMLASGSDDTEPDPTIKLWDPADGRLLSAWQGGEGTTASLAFSPDARLLVSGHLVNAGNVRIWDPGTGRLLATLEGHTDRVRATVFSPDGRILATAGSDHTVRLWDVAGRRLLGVLTGHADTCTRPGVCPRRPPAGLCQRRRRRAAVGPGLALGGGIARRSCMAGPDSRPWPSRPTAVCWLPPTSGGPSPAGTWRLGIQSG